MHHRTVETFDEWREQARELIQAGIAPNDVIWGEHRDQPMLFGESRQSISGSGGPPRGAFKVPQVFLSAARRVACHRDTARWSLLYRALWRMVTDEPSLMEVETDEDVLRIHQMEKAVSRDVHKMKAFVRFRRVEDAEGRESFIAWHRPDHRIVRLAAPFFSRRFKEMDWTILTPSESVHWDGRGLHYGPGMSSGDAPNADELESLWKTYYASIFNPARIKVAMMKREMPVRHWATLPEAELIEPLLREASGRVDQMIDRREGFATTAAGFIPATNEPVGGDRLSELREASKGCTACGLHECATATVFGQGPAHARVMIVGEQPGDEEDRSGLPFVGPAGKLLRDCLEEAGIDARELYLTNTVKHFKHVRKGKRRIHQKPDSREIYACRPWLEAEVQAVRPERMVLLGVTAAQALLGREFRMGEGRGRPVRTDWCDWTIATWHPAALLRMPDESRQRLMRDQLIRDLGAVNS